MDLRGEWRTLAEEELSALNGKADTGGRLTRTNLQQPAR